MEIEREEEEEEKKTRYKSMELIMTIWHDQGYVIELQMKILKKSTHKIVCKNDWKSKSCENCV